MKRKLYIIIFIGLSMIILGLFIDNNKLQKENKELKDLLKSTATENIKLYNKIDYLESHDCMVIMNEN